MTLGLSLSAFTTLHVYISVIAIGSGLIVLLALIGGRIFPLLTGLFLAATVATSVTGFLFPFHGVTPAIKLGIISMVVLAVALAARYLLHLAGIWRTTFVIASALALYLNCFVLVVQTFLKVPAIHALAPTQTEPPFKIAQATLLLLFILLTVLAVQGFRRSAAIVA
jgi:hypothetical protein